MARVAVSIIPEPGEREVVEEILADDAGWLVDGPVPDAEVLVTFWTRREFREAGIAWSDLPGLKLVQSTTAGLNHLPWDEIPVGVEVASAPGSSASAVAEHVLAFILWWTRRLRRHDREIRAGRFRNGAPVRAVRELTVGLVGYGGIGQATARLLGHLGARVEAVTRSGEGDEALAWVGTMDRLDEMMARCDAVVLCLPLVAETKGLIDARRLEGFSGERLLVNVARGAIVDEQALYDWLRADPAHAAALDVWWKYPLSGGHPFDLPFHELDNVLMTPHDSPNVQGFRRNMIRQGCEQVRHYLDTGEALHVQDRAGHEGIGGDDR